MNRCPISDESLKEIMQSVSRLYSFSPNRQAILRRRVLKGVIFFLCHFSSTRSVLLLEKEFRDDLKVLQNLPHKLQDPNTHSTLTTLATSLELAFTKKYKLSPLVRHGLALEPKKSSSQIEYNMLREVWMIILADCLKVLSQPQNE